jgi:hypothetical protein
MPNVTRAAHAAKINKSQHYDKFKSSPEYASAFQEALRMGCDALSDVAVTRATDGWEEPLVYQGRIVMQKDRGTGKVVPITVRRSITSCSGSSWNVGILIIVSAWIWRPRARSKSTS